MSSGELYKLTFQNFFLSFSEKLAEEKLLFNTADALSACCKSAAYTSSTGAHITAIYGAA